MFLRTCFDSLRAALAGRRPPAVPFLYRRTGMLFAEDKRCASTAACTARRGDRHAVVPGLFRAAALRARRRIERLVDAFTINETLFFREDHQLRCITSDLLGAVIRTKRPGDPIHPRSRRFGVRPGRETGVPHRHLAEWEFIPTWTDLQIEIVGSDIDTRALAATADGVYGARALMKLCTSAPIARSSKGSLPMSTASTPGCATRSSSPKSMHRCARDGAARREFDIILCRRRPHLFR